MGAWLLGHLFEFVQSAGIQAGLILSAYTIRKDHQARQLAILGAIKQDHIQIWSQLYSRPELARVLDRSANIEVQPVSTAEWLFVKLLMIHLGNVHQAMRRGLFVTSDGLSDDIRTFLSSPVAKKVWDMLKPLQNEDFVLFVKAAMKS